MGDDGRTGEASITVAADPERVWSLLSDVTRMGEWSPENERAAFKQAVEKGA